MLACTPAPLCAHHTTRMPPCVLTCGHELASRGACMHSRETAQGRGSALQRAPPFIAGLLKAKVPSWMNIPPGILQAPSLELWGAPLGMGVHARQLHVRTCVRRPLAPSDTSRQHHHHLSRSSPLRARGQGQGQEGHTRSCASLCCTAPPTCTKSSTAPWNPLIPYPHLEGEPLQPPKVSEPHRSRQTTASSHWHHPRAKVGRGRGTPTYPTALLALPPRTSPLHPPTLLLRTLLP